MAGLEPKEVAPLSFGANLRRERELRGITLDEISRETKISGRILEALESDRLDRLPGGVFRRGFVKTYARYIGLNEDKVLQEYALLVTGSEAQPGAEDGLSLRKPSPASAPSWSLKVTLGLFLVIVLVAFSLWYLRRTSTRSHAEHAPSPPAPATQQLAAPPSSTPQTEGSQPGASIPGMTAASNSPAHAPAQTGATDSFRQASPDLKVLGELAKKPEPLVPDIAGPLASGEASGQLNLQVTALAETWMSVEANQQTIYSGLVYPEQVKSFTLGKPLKVTLGNAGGVRFSVNNKPLVMLGKPGEVRILIISSENYQQFLAASEKVRQ